MHKKGKTNSTTIITEVKTQEVSIGEESDDLIVRNTRGTLYMEINTNHIQKQEVAVIGVVVLVKKYQHNVLTYDSSSGR